MKMNTQNNDMDYTKKSINTYKPAVKTAVRVLSKIGNIYVTAKKADDDVLTEIPEDRAYFGTI